MKQVPKCTTLLLGAPAREAAAADAAALLAETLAAHASSAASSAAAGDTAAAANDMAQAVTLSLRFLFGELRWGVTGVKVLQSTRVNA
jgi:outer membrane receptor protein involved in Fe transport